LQGALITDQEIKRVVNYIKDKTGEPNYIKEITERQKVSGVAGVGIDGASDDDDELLFEAKELIINSGKASASYLQRRLSIGYARAARLLDLLEESGIIGPSNGAKPREIFISKEQYEGIINQGVSGVRLHNQETAVAPDSYLDTDETIDDTDEGIDEETDDTEEALNDTPVDAHNDVRPPEVLSENDEIPENIEKTAKNDDQDDDFGKYFSR
jgi:hypothetical protein